MRRLAAVAFILAFSASLAYSQTSECVPFACLKSVDADSLGTRVPIILIHGINLGGIGEPQPECWNNFVEYFNSYPSLNNSFKLYRFEYYSNLYSVAELGTAMRDTIDLMDQNKHDTLFGDKEIIFLGHSMGGLVTRSALPLKCGFGKYAGHVGGASQKDNYFGHA